MAREYEYRGFVAAWDFESTCWRVVGYPALFLSSLKAVKNVIDSHYKWRDKESEINNVEMKKPKIEPFKRPEAVYSNKNHSNY